MGYFMGVLGGGQRLPLWLLWWIKPPKKTGFWTLRFLKHEQNTPLEGKRSSLDIFLYSMFLQKMRNSTISHSILSASPSYSLRIHYISSYLETSQNGSTPKSSICRWIIHEINNPAIKGYHDFGNHHKKNASSDPKNWYYVHFIPIIIYQSPLSIYPYCIIIDILIIGILIIGFIKIDLLSIPIKRGFWRLLSISPMFLSCLEIS